ncbi:transmembrane protease serine 11E-like [Capricornis sumatraensis]|uniref:transmembrane protease serine 11E-like n=1 Tax=Capricornis sumatraensis TaxID=34865 RepID=UPI0036047374
MGTIKDSNGKDPIEVEDIKNRWQEYTEELDIKGLNDADSHSGVITHPEPDILESEVKSSVVRARKRACLQPWVIGLISFISLIVLAVCIGLIVHYARYNQKKTYNYYSTLSFTSNKVYDEFGKEASENFTEMSQKIESMVKNAFHKSSLRGKFVKSHIIKFSQEERGVLAHMLLIFRFPSTEDPETINKKIQHVLHEKLQDAVGPPKLDPDSVEIKKINKTETDNFLNNCCGTRRNETSGQSLRIVGGTEVQEGEWPWQTSLQWDGIHRCGATLINDTWLVSAAHCFRTYNDPARWTASFGVTIHPPKMKQALRRIIVHEKYKYPSHDYDISVLELSRPVSYTNAVHKICLPDASHEFRPGDEMFVTGFGALQNDGSSQNHLRQVQVDLIDTKSCNAPQAYNNAITPTMLCAGSLKGNRDACQGDSGGPLVSPDARDIWYLAGIVSWGDECGQPNKPGVYTKVTAFRDWITSKTGV